jgi:hypothetical protein
MPVTALDPPLWCIVPNKLTLSHTHVHNHEGLKNRELLRMHAGDVEPVGELGGAAVHGGAPAMSICGDPVVQAQRPPRAIGRGPEENGVRDVCAPRVLAADFGPLPVLPGAKASLSLVRVLGENPRTALSCRHADGMLERK